MNTIIIYDQVGSSQITFFNIDGQDLSEYDNIYINGDNEKLGLEVDNIIYNKNSNEYNHAQLTKFPVSLITADTKVIVCGIY